MSAIERVVQGGSDLNTDGHQGRDGADANDRGGGRVADRRGSTGTCVSRLIVEGRRIMKIASSLNALDADGRRTHKSRKMMQTLGVHSTAELVRYALERRLVGN